MQRLAAPLGVILADVDGFKQVNVRLGQDQGDFILEQLARRLTSLVRPYDTLGRFDGDSFLVVLPICDEIATANVAGRLLAAVNGRDMDHALGKIRITISLAHLIADPEEADADLLIYRLQQLIARQREPATGADSPS